MKIVERTGSTLVDTLNKNNAWADVDCLRDDCIVCTSDIKGVKKGSCRKRNTNYETFFVTCQKSEQNSLIEGILEEDKVIDVDSEKSTENTENAHRNNVSKMDS